MAVNGIQIQVGQRWKMRNEGTTTVLKNNGDPTFPFDLCFGDSVTVDGRSNDSVFDSDSDLIELLYCPSFDGRQYEGFAPLTVATKLDADLLAAVKNISRVQQAPASEPGLAINPKDAIGSTKLPLHLWPVEATALGCLGMLEGKEKYGRNNYIAGNGVVASIYVDAAKRHIDAWFSGEEVSPDTLNDHLGNALACLAIIVKTRAHGKLIDDRDFTPNAGYRKLVEELTPNVKRLQTLFADKKPRHFTIADNQGVAK